MTEPQVDERYLEIFPAWLRTLGEDANALGKVVGSESPEAVRRYATAGLNYIFKSLDLIPDGIDDLGYMDDAFVLRVAASLALAETGWKDTGQDADAKPSALGRLAGEAKNVKDFLGEDYARLEAYVRGLRKGAARGRTVEDILADAATRGTFLHEVKGWADAYQVPSFTRDKKTLIKLKAFLSAKLA
jgi:uncharacterized membrane protein YkvA (DUF1232 family)